MKWHHYAAVAYFVMVFVNAYLGLPAYGIHGPLRGFGVFEYLGAAVGAGLSLLVWSGRKRIIGMVTAALVTLGLMDSAVGSAVVKYCYGIESCIYDLFKTVAPHFLFPTGPWIPGLIMGLIAVVVLTLLAAAVATGAQSSNGLNSVSKRERSPNSK